MPKEETTVTLASSLNRSDSAKRASDSNFFQKNSRSRKSSAELSKGRTNQKNSHPRERGALRTIDLMSTVQIRGNSRRNPSEPKYYHHTHTPKSLERKLATDLAGEPTRWERLYNLAGEKKEKMRQLQKQVHGYSFEGDPRVKETMKKNQGAQKSRGSSSNLRSPSPAMRKVNSSDLHRAPSSQDPAEKNTTWGSYKQSNLMSDGSVMYEKEYSFSRGKSAILHPEDMRSEEYNTESAQSQKPQRN